jgi:hypothetical protein
VGVPICSQTPRMHVNAPTPADVVATELLVRVVRAAFAIESSTPETVKSSNTFAGVDSAHFVNAVKVQRVQSLVAEHAKALDLPPNVADQVQQLAHDDAMKAMTLAQETARASLTLTQAGIRTVVMKGVALSAQTTGRITSRGGGDVDLLVAPNDVPLALEVLTLAGWQRWMPPELSDDWWPWFAALARETSLPGPRSNLDLHWRITEESRLLAPTREILERSDGIEVLGQRLHVLSEDDLLHATCYAYQLDRFRSLRMSLDVARVVRNRVGPPAQMSPQLQKMVEESVAVALQLVGGVTEEQVRDLGLARSLDGKRVRRGYRNPLTNLTDAYHVHQRPSVRVRRVRDVLRVWGEFQRVHQFDERRWLWTFRLCLRYVLNREGLRPPQRVTPSNAKLAYAMVRSLPRILHKLRPFQSSVVDT